MQGSSVKRVYTEEVRPFSSQDELKGYEQREAWPANWIQPVTWKGGSAVMAFRLAVSVEKEITIRCHVTADQRYWLYLDGERVGEGSERGCQREWFYETYEVTLSPGPHWIGALVWYLAENEPWAQASVQPGFLFAAEAPFTGLASTGSADWKARVLNNAGFLDPRRQVGQLIGSGARVHYAGDSWKNAFSAPESTWEAVRKLMPGNNAFWHYAKADTWVLHPGTLPAMRRNSFKGGTAVLVDDGTARNMRIDLSMTFHEEAKAWTELLNGGSTAVTIPSRTQRRVLIDLETYLCAYYELETQETKDVEIEVGWAERLSTQQGQSVAPPDRHQVDGLYFVGLADRFQPEGRGPARLEPLWWQSGRWIQIIVHTGPEPLVVKAFRICETGYPLQQEAAFKCSDKILNIIAPVCFRTLQCCAHETYMDCPYWEQLQYIGDTRLQILLTYTNCSDSRLPEKALEIYQHSMTGASPFPASNFPSRAVQVIPPFALWWIGMLHDYIMWRGNPVFVRKLMPMAWWIIDQFLLHREDSGLILSPQGWNYVDAVAFASGEPPGALRGETSALLNWQLVLALEEMGQLSQWLGERESAQRAGRLAEELAATCCRTFWDESRQAMADEPEHVSFSEHGQVLPILAESLSGDLRHKLGKALLEDPDLAGAGPYFSHYVLTALLKLGAVAAFHNRLRTWKAFLDAGFHTFPEHGMVGRSDCHAWSAHPLFHFQTGILGIRPASRAFEHVLIEPRIGDLRHAQGNMPHPSGMIEVKIDLEGENPSARIHLPHGLKGTFVWNGERIPLDFGENAFPLPGSAT